MPRSFRISTSISAIALSSAMALATVSCLAQPTITYRNALELDTDGVTDVSELSGVTMIGPIAGGLTRMAAIQDNGGKIRIFDVSLQSDGTLDSTSLVGTTIIQDDSLDSEGIAFTSPQRGTVFVSYEGDPVSPSVIPGVREYNLTSGNRLQSVTLPPLWTTEGNTRSNRGFESLTRELDGQTMWVANEEALTIDGGLATSTIGTLVRLQRLAVDGNSVAADRQFAYLVDPVHGANPDRSGLSELIALPGGGLLALERSAALSLPVFENRMYLVDTSSATDVSTPMFENGLIGQSFTTVEKTLLWSGQVVGAFGANLEGLTLGPQLAPYRYAMIGVVDNGGGTNGNSIVSFELTLPVSPGDFDANGLFECQDIDALIAEIVAGTNSLAFDLNGDGLVNGGDQSAWLLSAGLAGGFGGPLLTGDADLDGVVTMADFDAWNARRFMVETGWCGGDFNHDGVSDLSDFHLWNEHKFMVAPGVAAVPEPIRVAWWMLALVWVAMVRKPMAEYGNRSLSSASGVRTSSAA